MADSHKTIAQLEFHLYFKNSPPEICIVQAPWCPWCIHLFSCQIFSSGKRQHLKEIIRYPGKNLVKNQKLHSTLFLRTFLCRNTHVLHCSPPPPAPAPIPDLPPPNPCQLHLACSCPDRSSACKWMFFLSKASYPGQTVIFLWRNIFSLASGKNLITRVEIGTQGKLTYCVEAIFPATSCSSEHCALASC